MFRVLLFVLAIFSTRSVVASEQDYLSCLLELVGYSGTTESHQAIDGRRQATQNGASGFTGFLNENVWGVDFCRLCDFCWEMKAQTLANRRLAAYLGRIQERSEDLQLTDAEATRIQRLRNESESVATRLEANVEQVYSDSSRNSRLSLRRLQSMVNANGRYIGEFKRLAEKAREVDEVLAAARKRLPIAHVDGLVNELDGLAFSHLAAHDSELRMSTQYMGQLNRRSDIRFRYETRTTRQVPTHRHGATYWSLPRQEYRTETRHYASTRYLTYREAIFWGYSSRNPAEAIAKKEAPFVAAAQQARSFLDGLLRTSTESPGMFEELRSRTLSSRVALQKNRSSLAIYLQSTDAEILAQHPEDSPDVFLQRNTALLKWYDAILERHDVYLRQLQNQSPYILPFPRP